MIRALTRTLRISCRPIYFINNHISDTMFANPQKRLQEVNAESSLAQQIPLQSEKEFFLEENEIEARLLKVARHFEKFDLKAMNWEGDLIKDVGLDSLERIAFISSIEHEFTVIFEDRLFDNLHTLKQIKDQLLSDQSAF